MRVQHIVESILNGDVGVDSSISFCGVNEARAPSFSSRATKAFSNLTQGAGQAIIKAAVLGVITWAGTAILNALLNPRSRRQQASIVERAYPALVKDVLDALRPEITILMYDSTLGQDIDIEGVINKNRFKIDRVIDKKLPIIFKKLGDDIRDQVREQVILNVKAGINRAHQNMFHNTLPNI